MMVFGPVNTPPAKMQAKHPVYVHHYHQAAINLDDWKSDPRVIGNIKDPVQRKQFGL